MDIKEIHEHAEKFQTEIAAHKHYDDVQNALLAKATELKLTWPETRQFSEHVHKLKFGTKPAVKPAEKSEAA